MLIISRVIQGFGAGAIQPLGMAIISREFPPKQRGLALGFWAIAAAASVSFGPLIGGYLVDNFSWQLIFDVNVPIGIIGMAATLIIQSEYKSKKVRKFDLVGFISAVIFLPLLLYALSQGNAATNSDGWGAPYILVCLAISFIMMVVFITAEFTVDEPLLDLRLLSDRNFGICSLIMLMFSIGMFGSTFLLPLYLQNSLGYTALQAGAVFLPVGIIQGTMSPISGFLGNKINPKWMIITGVGLLAFSFYLNSSFSFLTERPYIMLGALVQFFGVIFLSGFLANRYGKKQVFIVCLALTTLFTAMFYFPGKKDVEFMFLLNFLKSLAYAPTVPLLWAMIADVADYSEYVNHRRATGLVFAGVVFALKAGLGIGGAILGFLLSGFGYVSGAGVNQSDTAINGILLSSSLIPAVTFFIGVVALYFYPITKKYNQKMQAELLVYRSESEN